MLYAKEFWNSAKHRTPQKGYCLIQKERISIEIFKYVVPKD